MLFIFLTELLSQIQAQYIILGQINLNSITDKELTIFIPKQFIASDLDFTLDYESLETFNISIVFNQENQSISNIEYQQYYQTITNQGSIVIPKIEINNNSYCYIKIQTQNTNNISLYTYYSNSQDRQVYENIEEQGILRNNSIIQYSLNMRNQKSSLINLTLKEKQLNFNCVMTITMDSNIAQSLLIQMYFQQYQFNGSLCQYRLLLTLQNISNTLKIQEGDILNIQLTKHEQYLSVKYNNLQYASLTCLNQIYYYYEQNQQQYLKHSHQIEVNQFQEDLEILLYCTNCENGLRCQYTSRSQSIELNQILEIEQKENSFQFFHFTSNLNNIKLDLFWKNQCSYKIYVSTDPSQSRPCNDNNQYEYSQVNELSLMTKTNYLFFSIFVDSQVEYKIKLYDPASDLIKLNTPIIKQICQHCYNDYEFVSNLDGIFILKLDKTEIQLQLQITENENSLHPDNKMTTNQLFIIPIKKQYLYNFYLTSLHSDIFEYQLEIDSLPTSDIQLVVSGQEFSYQQNENITYIIENKIKPSMKYFMFDEEMNSKNMLFQTTNNKYEIKMNQIRPNIIQIKEDNNLQFESFQLQHSKTLYGIYYELSQDSFQNQLISQAFNFDPIVIKKQNQLTFTIQTFPTNYLKHIQGMSYKTIVISNCGSNEYNNNCNLNQCETLEQSIDSRCDKFVIQFRLNLTIDDSNLIIMSEKYLLNQEEQEENKYLDYLLYSMFAIFVIILLFMIRRQYKIKQMRKYNSHNQLQEHKEDDIEDLCME